MLRNGSFMIYALTETVMIAESDLCWEEGSNDERRLSTRRLWTRAGGRGEEDDKPS